MDMIPFPGAWVLEAYRRGGVDLELLSQKLPHDVELMLHEMDTILPDPINRLLQACADISGDQNFGLTMNELVDLTMYGLFGYLLLNCSTVKELFETLVNYHTIHHNGGITYEMNIGEETVSIQFCHDERTHADHRHTSEWGLGFIPDFLKPTLGELSVPLAAHFMNSQPNKLDKLYAYFGNTLEFNQAEDQLIYPKSILDRHISDVDSQLLTVLRAQANKHLMELKKDDSLLKNTRAILFEHMNDGHNNAINVAESLHMSISVYKRKLNEEGINFKTIKESVRNELAKQILSQSNIKLYEVAHKVGFTNQSSFTRFFIRCNKQTPQKFRASKRTKKINN